MVATPKIASECPKPLWKEVTLLVEYFKAPGSIETKKFITDLLFPEDGKILLKSESLGCNASRRIRR